MHSAYALCRPIFGSKYSAAIAGSGFAVSGERERSACRLRHAEQAIAGPSKPRTNSCGSSYEEPQPCALSLREPRAGFILTLDCLPIGTLATRVYAAADGGTSITSAQSSVHSQTARMHRIARTLTLALTFCIAVSISTGPIAAAAGSPSVVRFSPQGTVKGIRQVTARFSDPMVALGDPRDTTAPFVVDCPAHGAARWIDSRNWSFDIDQDLPAGLRCTFKLRAGLK